jgi:hypothetical protein
MCASACSHRPEADDMALIDFMLYEAGVALLIEQSK